MRLFDAIRILRGKAVAEPPVRLGNGNEIFHHCSAVRTNSLGQLWLMSGQSPIAVYAKGEWRSWYLALPAEGRQPKPEETGIVEGKA